MRYTLNNQMVMTVHAEAPQLASMGTQGAGHAAPALIGLPPSRRQHICTEAGSMRMSSCGSHHHIHIHTITPQLGGLKSPPPPLTTGGGHVPHRDSVAAARPLKAGLALRPSASPPGPPVVHGRGAAGGGKAHMGWGGGAQGHRPQVSGNVMMWPVARGVGRMGRSGQLSTPRPLPRMRGCCLSSPP